MPKTAFSNGGSAAAHLPAEAEIRPGDEIRVTVLSPGRVLIERGSEMPQYTHFVRRRSKAGGNVTGELVARLLGKTGL
jgi:hypothetical protein